MAKVNRGKDFEHQVREGLQKVPNTEVYRLPDQITYRVGSKNPCDMFVFHAPLFYAIECKSVYGDRLPFANISEYQWSELLRMSKLPGIVSGILCWYIDRDRTVFIPIQFLETLKQNGAKSIRYDADDSHLIDIKGKKRKILWDYDFSAFLL